MRFRLASANLSTVTTALGNYLLTNGSASNLTNIPAAQLTGPVPTGPNLSTVTTAINAVSTALLTSTSTWSAWQTYLNELTISTDIYMSAGQINVQGNRLTTAAGKLDATQLVNAVPTGSVNLSTVTTALGNYLLTNGSASNLTNIPGGAVDRAGADRQRKPVDGDDGVGY